MGRQQRLLKAVKEALDKEDGRAIWGGWIVGGDIQRAFMTNSRWKAPQTVVGWGEIDIISWSDICGMMEQTWAMWQEEA